MIDIRPLRGEADDDAALLRTAGVPSASLVPTGWRPRVSYLSKRALIKFIGTHKDDDKIVPETVT